MTDTPLIFCEEQIKNFVLKMKEAATFTGPNNEPFIDEFIEAVLEEVQAKIGRASCRERVSSPV